MPPEAAAHLRDCSDCRDFVRRWDQIELGLQNLRDSVPSPSLDFRISLETRPKRSTAPRLHRNPLVYARWAAAAVVLIIALLAMTYALSGKGPLPPERAGSLAIVRPAPNTHYAPRPDPLKGELPLAQTR